MCGLCGLLAGESHWAERPVGVATPPRVERLLRVAYLNKLLKAYSFVLSDWHGGTYLLTTFTGKSELISNLAELWSAVETLSGIKPDPLTLMPVDAGEAMGHVSV